MQEKKSSTRKTISDHVREWGQRMGAWDMYRVYEAIGLGHLTSPKMPADFNGIFFYQGCKVYVYTSKSKPNRLYRTYAMCKCGKTFPTAKMGQHLKFCKGKIESTD